MGVGLCGWMRVWVGVAALASARYPGMEVTTCHNYDIAYKYRWQCQVCQQEYGRHSNSIDVDRSRCGKCRGALAPLPRMLADGTPSKRPQGGGLYAAFVKSNFKQVKAENADLTPAEVLRKLGVMWKSRQGEFGVQDERCAGGGEDRGGGRSIWDLREEEEPL